MARGETVKEARYRLVYESKGLRGLIQEQKDFEKAFDHLVETTKQGRARMAAALEEKRKREQKDLSETKTRLRQEAQDAKTAMDLRLRDMASFANSQSRFVNQYASQVMRAHAQERAENSRHFREVERQEQEHQRRRAAYFKEASQSYGRIRGRQSGGGSPGGLGGFGGISSGGPFLGVGMSGPMGMAAAAAMELGQAGWRQAKTGMESDYSIQRMMTLVGSDERRKGATLDVMSEQARRLARELGISIPEAADAMREALTNAISAGKASEFVKMANSLSMLEGTDLKSSVQSLASIKNVYGFSDDQMKLVPDVLFAAVDKGNVKLTELASQIGQVSGMTKEAGIGFKELMATLAAATIKGMPGDVAATSMRAVASAVLSPSASVAKEQERILGQRMTPEYIRSVGGVTNALVLLGKAIETHHSSWTKAFSEEIRARKILPYLLENEGANVAKALQDQIDDKGRADQANKELMDTASKRWARTSEEWSQIGQGLGKVFAPLVNGKFGLSNMASSNLSMAGLVLDKVGLGLTGNGLSYTGQKMFGGKNQYEVTSKRDTIDAADEDQLRLYRYTLQRALEKDNRTTASDYDWDRKTRTLKLRKPLEENDESPYPDWMKKDAQFYGINKPASDEDAKTLAYQAQERSVQRWMDSIKNARDHYKTIVERYLPVVDHAQNAAASAATHWAAEIEKVVGLERKVEESSAERKQNFANSLSGGSSASSILGKMNLTAQSNLLATSATKIEEITKYRGDAIKSFGSLGSENLLSVAKRGFKQKDVDKYVEREIENKGLTGGAAMSARTQLYGQVGERERDVQSAYTQFKMKTTYKDKDFSKWYAERGSSMIDESLKGSLGDEKNQAQGKYDAAIEAHNSFRDLSQDIKKNWESIETFVTGATERLASLGDNPNIAKFMEELSGIRTRIDVTGRKVESLDPNAIKNKALGFRTSGRLEEDLSDPKFPAPMKTVDEFGKTVNHIQVDAPIEVKFDPDGMDPALVARLIANGLVPAIETEIDQGRSRLKTRSR